MKEIIEIIEKLVDNDPVTEPEYNTYLKWMQEMKEQIEKEEAEKQERKEMYQTAWEYVRDYLKANGASTVSAIHTAICKEPGYPETVTRARIQYGLLHYWTEWVEVSDEKPKTYSLKE